MRPYVGAELEAVVRCFQRSVHVIGARYYGPEQVAAWAPEPPDLAAWARRLATGGVLVADADAAVAGFVRVEESGWIDLLYVHPEHQRRGIGRSLLAHACSWAAARGARRWATDASLAARPLFASLGFRVETEQWVERHGVSFRNFRMARDAGQPMEAGP